MYSEQKTALFALQFI